MKQRTPINPMPESLDDTQINPNDVIGPNQTVNIPPSAPQVPVTPSVPGEVPSTQKRNEIDEVVTARLTEEALNREILNEKIRDDLSTTKQNPVEAKTPRDILKSLIAKGDYTEDRKIFGSTWTMKALSQNDLILAFSDITEETVNIVGRAATLTLSQITYAIQACNGVSVYEWFSDIVQRSKFDTSEEYKLAVRRVLRRYLGELPNSVIQVFNEAYAEIEAKRNEAVLELKNS